MTDDDLEVLNAARREIHEAVGRYVDGWGSTAGGIVTALVVLAEVACPDGEKALVEIRGAGHDASDAVPAWLRRGMLHDALYDPPSSGDNE